MGRWVWDMEAIEVARWICKKVDCQKQSSGQHSKPRTDKSSKQQSLQIKKKESQASTAASFPSQQLTPATSSSKYEEDHRDVLRTRKIVRPMSIPSKMDKWTCFPKYWSREEGLNCENSEDQKRWKRLMTPNNVHITSSSATLPEPLYPQGPDPNLSGCSSFQDLIWPEDFDYQHDYMPTYQTSLGRAYYGWTDSSSRAAYNQHGSW